MTASPAAHPETTEPAEPTPVSPQRRNLIFVAVLLGMLLAALDQTIVATALPTVVADLGGAGHQAWVVTSYLLASTIVTAIVGKLGDLFGRKTVFIAAVLFFLAGSVLCGIAGVDGDAGGVPRAAGHRRRRHHGHRDGGDRRGDPAARTRPLPGRARRGVRRDDRDRPAARRLLHRPPELALGVLDQRARWPSSCSSSPSIAIPNLGRHGAPGHRLRRHRAGRSRRHRAHAGHQLGRQHLRVGLADDHRAVRRLGGGHRRLRRRRTARRGTDPADAAVPRARCSRCAACCRSSSASRCSAR